MIYFETADLPGLCKKVSRRITQQLRKTGFTRNFKLGSVEKVRLSGRTGRLSQNSMEIYFWGQLKQIVYSTNIPDLDNLKSRIIDIFLQIDGAADFLNHDYKNFDFRIGSCIAVNGEHIVQLYNF